MSKHAPGIGRFARLGMVAGTLLVTWPSLVSAQAQTASAPSVAGAAPASPSGPPAMAPGMYGAQTAPYGAPPPAPTTAAPGCPVCPPGYVCYAGGCMPAYPSCAPGYYFDGRYCVPPFGDPPVDQAEEAARQARLQDRLRPHFTIDLQGGIGLLGVQEWDSDLTVPTPSAALLLGYRQSFSPSFGLLLRGGPLLGAAILDYSPTSNNSSSTRDSASDSTLMIGALFEASPFFGPFGRFYFGPSVWAGYLSFDKQTLRAETDTHGTGVFHVADGPTYGVGATGGILVGETERTDITFTARIDLNPDHKTTIFLMAGVGFHR